jgi:alpha-glucoside transport system substrate-binding protein
VRKFRFRNVVALTTASLLLAACLGEGDEAAGGGEEGDIEGATVRVMSAFTGDEANLFRESFAVWEEESGASVDYEEAAGFETVITTRVQGGDPPDIALFPQPGLLMDIVEQTDALPISEYLDIEQVESDMIEGFLDATTDDSGEAYGLPMRMAVKSALWYPVPEFEEAGYELPETLDDLEALEDEIIADGNTPWCIGMESGDSTGWVGTDWVEEYMLRFHGPDVYDDWVNNDLAFDSPEVQEAFEAFGDVWQKDGNVVGGAQGLTSISFGDSPAPMFEDEPGCYLHRQGNFVTGFFPEDVQEDLDANIAVTYFPEATDGFDGAPVLAGGDLALLINDTPVAREFMAFLASPEFGEPWANAGGWLSPNVNFDVEQYPDQVTADLYQIGADSDILRFDASDLMPGAVGTGTFWTGIVDWVSGRQDLETILTNIQNSWPAPGEEETPTEEAEGEEEPAEGEEEPADGEEEPAEGEEEPAEGEEEPAEEES